MDGEIVHVPNRRPRRPMTLFGRPHKDVEPTYYGDSVGRWEGDTLVIDSTTFKRWSLDDYYYIDPTQYRMHTEAFHTIERLRRVDANTIAYQFTVDDPPIFSAPCALVTGLRDEAASGVGEGRSLRVRMPGEQSVRRGEV
jgi:hypothetical protein